MENKPRITIEVDEDFRRAVKTKAANQGKSIRDIIIGLLAKWLRCKNA